MTTDTEPLRDAFLLQAQGCEALRSPFTAGVLRAIADQIEAGGPFRDLLAPWAGRDATQVLTDAVPLRVLGGLQYLVLDGRAEALAAEYPARRPEPDWPLLRERLSQTARDRYADLEAFMTSPPQTNEVRRAICLLGGFLTVAGETGLPLRCLEIGASAGLNMNWDAFRYDLDDLGVWGDSASTLVLDTNWSGPPPLLTVTARVAERAGCDQRPVDLTDERQALRLRSYIWPDQLDRLARLDAAIAFARRSSNRVEQADAAAWAAEHAHPKSGAATVMYHSVVWQYLPDAVRSSLERTVAVAGAASTPSAPFAWLRMEPELANPHGPMEVRLTLWPGGEERLLAVVHPHGAFVRWQESGAKPGAAR